MSGGRLGGVIAAVPTPIANGAPDPERFLRHAEWALANGCDALNVLGTTGEATSFSPQERKGIMSAAADRLDRAKLMVGTGMPDLETTAELTRFAHDKGFAAALVLPPFYYKGVSDDGLFAWFEALVAATEGAAIPLYLYNFPQMTGISFSPALARRLAEAFPDRLEGVKDSSGDLGYAAQIAEVDGLDVFPSSEVALATADGYGFAGCISATVNVDPRPSASLWKDRGNPELLAEVERIRTGVSAGPLIPGVKYLVGRIHGDSAYEALRPPLMPLDDEWKAALDALGIA